MRKTFPDSFEDSNLETVLAGLEVGRLVVAGAQTDERIRSHPARGDPAGLRRDAGG